MQTLNCHVGVCCASAECIKLEGERLGLSRQNEEEPVKS